MGRLPSNNRKYELRRLQDNHREMLRLSALGYDRKKIAAILGVTTATVSNARNSELGRAQSEVLANGRDSAITDINQKIQALLPDAITLMGEVAKGKVTIPEGSNVTITQRMKASQDLIGRGGYVPPTRVQHSGDVNHHMTVDDIKKIKEKAASLKVNGFVIDAEVIEPARLEDGNAEDSNT